jgi:hypothetical protein
MLRKHFYWRIPSSHRGDPKFQIMVELVERFHTGPALGGGSLFLQRPERGHGK